MRQKKNIFFFTREIHGVFCRIAKKLEGKDFVDAESFAARDKICRIFASECFELAQKLEKKNKKLSLQYMKLAAKLLGMSLRPKKLEDIEAIKKALADLKAQEPEEAE